MALWIFCKLHSDKGQPEWLIVEITFKESNPSFSYGAEFFPQDNGSFHVILVPFQKGYNDCVTADSTHLQCMKIR